MFDNCPFDPLDVYDAADLTAVGAVVGQKYYLPKYKAFFILVKNKTGGSTIAAKRAIVAASGVAWTSFNVELAGSDSDKKFVGVRVPSATDLAADQFGLVQVSGLATMTYTDQAGDTATTQGGGVKIDGSGAGKIDGTGSNNEMAEGCFGTSFTATSTDDADVIVRLNKSVFH